jgi:hypothetical protein
MPDAAAAAGDPAPDAPDTLSRTRHALRSSPRFRARRSSSTRPSLPFAAARRHARAADARMRACAGPHSESCSTASARSICSAPSRSRRRTRARDGAARCGRCRAVRASHSLRSSETALKHSRRRPRRLPPARYIGSRPARTHTLTAIAHPFAARSAGGASTRRPAASHHDVHGAARARDPARRLQRPRPAGCAPIASRVPAVRWQARPHPFALASCSC